MSSTNTTQLAFEEESTFGTTPGSAGTIVRYTGESLRADTSTADSAEIRTDRSTVNVLRTSVSCSGSINGELPGPEASITKLMQYALQSSGAMSGDAIMEAETTHTINAGAKTITISGSWDHTPSDNEWIRLTKAGVTEYLKVNGTPSSTVVTVHQTPVTTTGPTITSHVCGQMVNAATMNSLSIERKHTDTSRYDMFRGMVVSGMGVEVSSDGYFNTSFDFTGKDQITATSAGLGSYTAATTTPVLAGIDNNLAVYSNGAPIACTSWSFNAANALRTTHNLGSAAPTGVGNGTLTVSGTLQAYNIVGSETELDLYLAGTETSLSFVVGTEGSSFYVFDFPSVRLTSAQRVAGGKDSDIIVDYGWSAFMNSDEAIMMKIAQYTP